MQIQSREQSKALYEPLMKIENTAFGSRENNYQLNKSQKDVMLQEKINISLKDSKQKQDFNEKENRNSISLNERQNNQTTQAFNLSSQPNQLLQQVFLMLAEIKNQNQYLIERNTELEQTINQEIKPMMRDGFIELRSEIRDVKRKIKTKENEQVKRYRFMQTRAHRKFQSTQKLYTVNQTEPSQEEESQKGQDERLQLDVNAESTFMRKLEETVQDQKPITDDMRFSIGANLLQMMQQNSLNQQKKPRVRNFNFRCNLKEIDKIIEEELGEGNGQDQSNYEMSVNASPMNKLQFDQTIEKQNREIEEAEAREFNQNMNIMNSNDGKNTSFKIQMQRPGTGMRVDGPRQRKMWGVNPRKSIKGRPKTGAAQKINKTDITRLSSEDPILALLRQQQSQEQPQIQSVLEIEGENKIESNNYIQNKSVIDQIQELKIEDLEVEFKAIEKQKPQIIEETKQSPQQQQINQQQQNPQPQQRRGNLPVRRGMFKAPPSNLIESLLMEDSHTEEIKNQKLTELPETKKAITPIRIQRNFIGNMKVNNFVVDKSKSRSRSRARHSNNQPKSTSNNKQKQLQAKKFGPINFCDNDSEEDQEAEQNPFQFTRGMINFTKNQNQANEAESDKFTDTEKGGAFFINDQGKNKKNDSGDFNLL
ncbi:UNKNOWN [Stylonychia lemnae]|uniref:Uncharacterized protein n=1 Tax=Stylonychia lemnae TaxID=5949 RepID=A0A078A2N0_STYLE|nr:UNKNOWN [Stylonychia lemnae]|eukprot:CDW76082.1 UNKNOWN [Stylonychia lemnae]